MTAKVMQHFYFRNGVLISLRKNPERKLSTATVPLFPVFQREKEIFIIPIDPFTKRHKLSIMADFLSTVL